MKYAILVYESQEAIANRTGPGAGAYWGAYTAYSQALGEAKVAAGGHGLQAPATGTTLRVTNGKRHVQDGPYSDTKEQLGGLFIVDVANLDEALEWAARCPSAVDGSVEVRPVLQMPN